MNRARRELARKLGLSPQALGYCQTKLAADAAWDRGANPDAQLRLQAGVGSAAAHLADEDWTAIAALSLKSED